MGVFSAGIAHEINNPANFISAGQQNLRAQLGEFKHYIDQLMDDDADADVVNSFHARFKRFDQSLDGIEEGVKRITSVVGRLRALNPEGQTHAAPADLVDALQAAWDVVEPMAGGPVAVETDWRCHDHVECRVAEIHQVLVAVCSNAALALSDLHLSRDAVFLPRVRLYSRREGDSLILGITDNGAGVPAAIADRIFDPFFTTRMVGQGTGLGLSSARDTLRRYHGEINLLRHGLPGATFEIRLPFVQPASAQA
jgi:signal transduction histidine kinase